MEGVRSYCHGAPPSGNPWECPSGPEPEAGRGRDERGRAPAPRSTRSGASPPEPRVGDGPKLRRARVHHQDLDVQPFEVLLGTRAGALLHRARPQEGRASGCLTLPPPGVVSPKAGAHPGRDGVGDELDGHRRQQQAHDPSEEVDCARANQLSQTGGEPKGRQHHDQR